MNTHYHFRVTQAEARRSTLTREAQQLAQAHEPAAPSPAPQRFIYLLHRTGEALIRLGGALKARAERQSPALRGALR